MTGVFSTDPRSTLSLRDIAMTVTLPDAFAWFGFEGAFEVLEARRMQTRKQDTNDGT